MLILHELLEKYKKGILKKKGYTKKDKFFYINYFGYFCNQY